MGFYLRKSVRVGPLRFNLSKSGIGVSAGIPGFRVGMGPRGNYVQAGRGGIYYRATLPSGVHTPAVSPTAHTPTASRNAASSPHATVGPQEAIESASVLAMRDDSAAGLLAELNEKRSRWRLTPILAVLAIIGAALLWRSLPLAGQVAVVVFASAALLAVHQVDVLRKSTVVIYDLDSDAAASYQQLIDAIGAVGEANRVWHVPSQAQVFDRKYHAGAESQIRRTETGVTLGSAPFLKCNLDVSRLGVGVQTLYFFPDRLLVFDSSSIGAVAYEHLTVEQQRVQFIEESGVPSDSRVVGRTWRYMNKRGGPDRRFKDNRELPICEYEALHFRSTSGLNELLHASKVGVGDALIRYLTTRGRDQPAERQPPPHR